MTALEDVIAYLKSRGLTRGLADIYIRTVVRAPPVRDTITSFFESVVSTASRVKLVEGGKEKRVTFSSGEWKGHLWRLANYLPLRAVLRREGGEIEAFVFRPSEEERKSILSFDEQYATDLLQSLLREVASIDLEGNSIRLLGKTYKFESRNDIIPTLLVLNLHRRVEKEVTRRLVDSIPPTLLAEALLEGRASVKCCKVEIEGVNIESGLGEFVSPLSITVETDLHLYPNAIVSAKVEVGEVEVTEKLAAPIDEQEVAIAVEKVVGRVKRVVERVEEAFREVGERWGPPSLETAIHHDRMYPAVRVRVNKYPIDATITVIVEGIGFAAHVDAEYWALADAYFIARRVEEKAGIRVTVSKDWGKTVFSFIVEGKSLEELLDVVERGLYAVKESVEEFEALAESARRVQVHLGEGVAFTMAYVLHQVSSMSYLLLVGLPMSYVHRRVGALLSRLGLRLKGEKIKYTEGADEVLKRLALAGFIGERNGEIFIGGKPFSEVAEVFREHNLLITDELLSEARARLAEAVRAARAEAHADPLELIREGLRRGWEYWNSLTREATDHPYTVVGPGTRYTTVYGGGGRVVLLSYGSLDLHVAYMHGPLRPHPKVFIVYHGGTGFPVVARTIEEAAKKYWRSERVLMELVEELEQEGLLRRVQLPRGLTLYTVRVEGEDIPLSPDTIPQVKTVIRDRRREGVHVGA